MTTEHELRETEDAGANQKAGPSLVDRIYPDEDAGANADSYSALSAALDDVPSHVHPPRYAATDVLTITTTPDSIVDSVIAEAGETLRPSIAIVNREITRRAEYLAHSRRTEQNYRDELRHREAHNRAAAAGLLDLMRDAGVASTMVKIEGTVQTVTVVVKHDHRIDDLDAAILALNLDGVAVPMTEPVPAQVDQAAIKRIAKVRPDGLAGVVPTESAHLRWT